MKRSEIVEEEAVKLTCVLKEYALTVQKSYQNAGHNQVENTKKGLAGQGDFSLRDHGDYAKMVFTVPS